MMVKDFAILWFDVTFNFALVFNNGKTKRKKTYIIRTAYGQRFKGILFTLHKFVLGEIMVFIAHEKVRADDVIICERRFRGHIFYFVNMKYYFNLICACDRNTTCM